MGMAGVPAPSACMRRDLGDESSLMAFGCCVQRGRCRSPILCIWHFLAFRAWFLGRPVHLGAWPRTVHQGHLVTLVRGGEVGGLKERWEGMQLESARQGRNGEKPLRPQGLTWWLRFGEPQARAPSSGAAQPSTTCTKSWADGG